MHEGIPQNVLGSVAARADEIIQEIQRVYIGPRSIPELLLTGLLASGHVLLEGVPGVAKTTLVKAFAATLGCSFRRIQFTPDLLPADITGTFVLSPNEGTFQLREGPVFAHIVLGDEINRAPAKTQSALLEAMQEGQVTIEGETRPLPAPFIVLATQNPIDQAGTYPLPEAQVDRFLLRLNLGYPEVDAERALLRRFLGPPATPRALLNPQEILSLRAWVGQVHLEEEIIEYIVRLATDTRRNAHLYLGASPRAGLALMQAARARALLAGRPFVLPDDVKALAPNVLAHRLVLTPEAEMEGVTTENLIHDTLRRVRHRREG